MSISSVRLRTLDLPVYVDTSRERCRAGHVSGTIHGVRLLAAFEIYRRVAYTGCYLHLNIVDVPDCRSDARLASIVSSRLVRSW